MNRVATRPATQVARASAGSCLHGGASTYGFLAAAVADGLGPRYGLGLGAIACLAAAIVGAAALRRMPAAEQHARRPREIDWHSYQQANESHA